MLPATLQSPKKSKPYLVSAASFQIVCLSHLLAQCATHVNLRLLYAERCSLWPVPHVNPWAGWACHIGALSATSGSSMKTQFEQTSDVVMWSHTNHQQSHLEVCICIWYCNCIWYAAWYAAAALLCAACVQMYEVCLSRPFARHSQTHSPKDSHLSRLSVRLTRTVWSSSGVFRPVSACFSQAPLVWDHWRGCWFSAPCAVAWCMTSCSSVAVSCVLVFVVAVVVDHCLQASQHLNETYQQHIIPESYHDYVRVRCVASLTSLLLPFNKIFI